MHEAWNIRERSLALQARRWSVERSLRSLQDGAPHEFFTVRMPDFVHVIALTSRDELVMVKQFRHGVERLTLEMPGGLVDVHEPDPMEAARRELLEETGYEGTLSSVGWVYPNPALLNNRCHFFGALDVVRTRPPSLEATEDAEVVLVPRKGVEEMIARDEISNALMIAGLKRFELWMRER